MRNQYGFAGCVVEGALRARGDEGGVMRALDEMGPVDYLVVSSVDLVDRGVSRVIDLTFVKKESDGSVTVAGSIGALLVYGNSSPGPAPP